MFELDDVLNEMRTPIGLLATFVLTASLAIGLDLGGKNDGAAKPPPPPVTAASAKAAKTTKGGR